MYLLFKQLTSADIHLSKLCDVSQVLDALSNSLKLFLDII